MLTNLPIEWYSITYDALFDLWRGFLISIPKLIGSLIVLLAGWIVASAVSRVIRELLEKLRFNEMFKKAGWGEALKRADVKVDVSEFLGGIVKWMLVFVFLLAAVQILGFLEFAVFLTKILAFLPNVIIAVLIFVVAVILADILEKVTVASVEKANVGYAKAAGMMVRWAILVFALLAILVQLGIAKQLIMTLFTGIVAWFVIAFGLAFGLGGKDTAAEILQGLRNRLR